MGIVGKHLSAIKTIRKECIECSGGSAHEVKKCRSENCALYAYRFGIMPETAERHGRLQLDEGRRFNGATRAIRARCKDCAESSSEIMSCMVEDCILRPYRFGFGPETAKKRGYPV